MWEGGEGNGGSIKFLFGRERGLPAKPCGRKELGAAIAGRGVARPGGLEAEFWWVKGGGVGGGGGASGNDR